MMAFRYLTFFFLLLMTMSCSKKVQVTCDPLAKEKFTLLERYEEDLSFAPYLEKIVVVLDPGHGGKDFGTEASITKEKEYNLMTAKLVAVFLKQMGFEVCMTRDEDTFISLQKRAHFANSLKSDLFISIHYNAAPNSLAEGIEVFYYRQDKNYKRQESSKQLAQSILKQVITTTGAPSRGVKNGNLAVIRETSMAAVLIECGFLTSPNELAKINTALYRRKIAKGIALGVLEYIKDINLKSKKVVLGAI